MSYDDYEEDDTRYIPSNEAKPKQIHFGSGLGTGHYQDFQCPSCGSYNTESGTYFDKCNSCDWGTAY